MLDPLEQQKPPGRDRAERAGLWVSGVGHTVLVLWAIVGGALFAASESPRVETTEVTTISNQQFEEMAARSRGAGPVGQADGDAPVQPHAPGDTSAPEGPDVAIDAPTPDTSAAVLPQPPVTTEDAPDLSDLDNANRPVEVATLGPAPQQVPGEDAPAAPTAEAAPSDTVAPSLPDTPAPPVPSPLALTTSRRPPESPAGLREAVLAARAAEDAAAAELQAEQDRQAAATRQAEEDRQAALDAEAAADRQEQDRQARIRAEQAEDARQRAAEEERQAAQQQQAEEERQAQEERTRQERLAEDARRAEEERQAQEERARQERLAEDARRAEEERQAQEERARQERLAEDARRAEEERQAQEERARQERLAEDARRAEEERQRLAREAEEQDRLRQAAADAELARLDALAEQLAAQQRLQDAAAQAQEATPSPVDGNAPEGEGEGGGSDVLTDALNEAGASAIVANDLDDALADAMGETRPSELPRQDGVEIASVPMTQAERNGFRDAVQSCWNLATLSTDASTTRVVVGFTMSRDGRPDPDSFAIVGTPEEDPARLQAFEAARRAVMRCAGTGYDLPADKYNEWDEVEMTFTPAGVEGMN